MVATRVDTAASAIALWQVLADIERWPSWLPTVDAVTPDRPGEPATVGSAYVVRQPKLPKARWVITDWRPDSGFTWQAKAPGVTSTATHELTSLPDGGSRIDLAIDWDGPLAFLLRVLYRNIARSYIDIEAHALADRASRSG